MEYQEFRNLEPKDAVRIIETGHTVDNIFFSNIERSDYEFTAPVIDAYVLSVRKRVRQWGGTKETIGPANTIIFDTDLYATLRSELRELHPNDVWFKKVKGKPTYKSWIVPDGIDKMVKGLDTSNSVPWSCCKQILAVCNPWLNHWVTIRIDIDEWKVELYDSMSETYDYTKPSLIEHEMKPITRLLPVILAKCGFWNNSRRPKRDGEMKLEKMSPEYQFVQTTCI